MAPDRLPRSLTTLLMTGRAFEI
ncbi:hypothetical protein ZOSMA_9G01130 [Zostera marina]|uniref:Uncharacterized protein n=1 Tax=Zostera marina TaxID=29655 RepID=A0A0K9NH93_ZOSMR|nr:hypothetical protein ZOSMA_9G01130 [Zostera marina]